MVSSQLQIIEKLISEIDSNHVQRVTIEGFPLRAYTDWQSTYLAWNSIVFQRAWNLTNTIYQTLQANCPKATIKHFLLLDDQIYHPDKSTSQRPNRDKIADDDFLQQTLSEIQCEFAQPLPILSNIDFFLLEGTIQAKKPKATCAQRDMYFQFQKFSTGVQEDRLLPNMIHIVVHPVIYQQQQQDMLLALENYIGNQQDNLAFKNMRRSDKRSLWKGYRHIWINKQGEIASLTKPHFDKKFTHQKI